MNSTAMATAEQEAERFENPEAEAISLTVSRKSPTAFRTISEVAVELDVPQHVLRFWETKFSQIRPLKRGGGRRYYRPEDVGIIKAIYRLLYSEGYTIKGAQKLFREKGKGQLVEENVAAIPQPQARNENKPDVPAFSPSQRAALLEVVGELKALRGMLNS